MNMPLFLVILAAANFWFAPLYLAWRLEKIEAQLQQLARLCDELRRDLRQIGERLS